jgi:hypothetical protein
MRQRPVAGSLEDADVPAQVAKRFRHHGAAVLEVVMIVGGWPSRFGSSTSLPGQYSPHPRTKRPPYRGGGGRRVGDQRAPCG